jgi:tRNA pseudouridine55 synthase
MARRKKGNPVHGWVVLDKPIGVTSTQAVAAVKRVFDANKAGHAGTLDPMASGVLAVALGEATKTVPYAMDAEKTYRFTAVFGEARDTDDTEGRVTATSDSRPSRKAIEAAIPRFTGELIQTPPAFSAIKVMGMRAYDIARDGETPDLTPRTVSVRRITLIEHPDPDHALFEMVCGKGTYVRAWVRDFSIFLGTYGYVGALRRLQVGRFHENDAIGLETLKGFLHSPAAFEHLKPVTTALDGIPALAMTGEDIHRLRSGNSVLIRASGFALIVAAADGGDPQGLTVLCKDSDGGPVALATFSAGSLRPFRVFNF